MPTGGVAANKNVALCCMYSILAWAVVVSKTSQVWTADATPRVGTWDWGKAQEELLDNDGGRGEREERPGRKKHPWKSRTCTSNWRYETLTGLVGRLSHYLLRSKLGLVTLLQRGTEKGSTGWQDCWAVVGGCTHGARDCGQGRARTAARMHQSTISRLITRESCCSWYGVAWRVHVCMYGCVHAWLCLWGWNPRRWGME